jgi:hypothetical protein
MYALMEIGTYGPIGNTLRNANLGMQEKRRYRKLRKLQSELAENT